MCRALGWEVRPGRGVNEALRFICKAWGRGLVVDSFGLGAAVG